jgi:hypothetical protein
MSNTNKHHSEQPVFSRQSYTTIVQQFPTSGLVPTGHLTNGKHPARPTRIIPLDVADDISLNSARLPAAQTAERPGHPTHQPSRKSGKEGTRTDIAPAHKHLSHSNGQPHPHRRRVVTLGHFESHRKSEPRTNSKRPEAQARPHSSGHPSARETPQHPDSTPASEEQLERPLRGVRQDKAREDRARTASLQPAPVTKVTRALFTNNTVVRSQNSSGARQKSDRVTLWVDPVVKTHLARLAEREGLSVSAAGAAFLRKALQQDIDLEYSALLEPIIEKATARQMRGIATRLSWLLVRVAFDAGQTRSIATNILGRQAGMNQDLLKTILAESGKAAKANITRRTPQITDLISAVEKWIVTDDRGE